MQRNCWWWSLQRSLTWCLRTKMGRNHPAHTVCRRRRHFIVPCAEAERKSLARIGRDQKLASARPRPLQHARAPNVGIGYVVPLDRAPQDPVELVVIRAILARQVEARSGERSV